jgi:hypothetical protein
VGDVPLVVAVSVPGEVFEQIAALVGETVLVNEQANVDPEHGPEVQSFVYPNTFEEPVVLIVPVVSNVPEPVISTLPFGEL